MKLGIDIGGTSVKLGLIDADGAIIRRGQVPTGREMHPEPLVTEIVRSARELAESDPVDGVGIAAPGFRQESGEGVVNVSNLPHIEGYPFRSVLESELGLPTRLDNDANAAAMGEYRYGGGRGSRRLLVVTIGTGIGAGMVVDGGVHRVSWQGLGDPGHVLVLLNGPHCACGGHGCLETIAAVPAMLRDAAARCGTEFATFGALVEAATTLGGGAAEVIQGSGTWIGMGLATLCHVLGPERILLGGGALDAAGDLLFSPIRSSLFEHVQPFLAERLTLGRASLGNDAGMIGAAALL